MDNLFEWGGRLRFQQRIKCQLRNAHTPVRYAMAVTHFFHTN